MQFNFVIKNSELLIYIIVNTECQQSRHKAVYISYQIFDKHEGAGASSTSVNPLPGNWPAARIADLTPDLQVLLP